jgi:hypothetical protein
LASLVNSGLLKLGQLALASADGSYTRFLARLAKTQLLVLDDFGLAPLTDTEIIYDLDLDGASARCLAAQPSDPGEGVETGVEAHDPSAPTLHDRQVDGVPTGPGGRGR